MRIGCKVLFHICKFTFFYRGPRVCELWCHLYTTVETRQHGTLPVQRLWTLSQDEWPEQTTHQTQTQAGKSRPLLHPCVFVRMLVYVCICVLR